MYAINIKQFRGGGFSAAPGLSLMGRSCVLKAACAFFPPRARGDARLHSHGRLRPRSLGSAEVDLDPSLVGGLDVGRVVPAVWSEVCIPVRKGEQGRFTYGELYVPCISGLERT